MLTIPVQAVPSQQFNVDLAGQNCTINLYQTAYGMFCDLLVTNVLIVGGVACQNLNRIVRDLYLGFVGDLAFQDTQGSSDPYYTGLGTRYVLLYLEATDVPVGVG